MTREWIEVYTISANFANKDGEKKYFIYDAQGRGSLPPNKTVGSTQFMWLEEKATEFISREIGLKWFTFLLKNISSINHLEIHKIVRLVEN